LTCWKLEVYTAFAQYNSFKYNTTFYWNIYFKRIL